MFKTTIKMITLTQNQDKRNVLSIAIGFTMMLILILTSGFNTISEEDCSEIAIVNPICENPLADALGYNAFVRYATHLSGGDTEGPIALGGDLTMNGIITVAAQTPGTNFFNGDDTASSLVINGKIQYVSGQGIQLNQGYIKIGNLSNSSVFDKDFNNASVNTRVTTGNYQDTPRLQVHTKQASASVSHGDLIDFEAAFAGFDKLSHGYSTLTPNLTLTNDYKITLAQNEVNVLNLTGNALQSLPYLTFTNKPNKETPLVINIDASGDLEWNIFNLAGIGDQQGAFIIWNFFNVSSLTLKGGGTIVGTVLASAADVIKDSSGNINGQVIAANYFHNQGELHQHIFDSCIDIDQKECELTVDAGEDQAICLGDEVTLTAQVDNEKECVDCTEFAVEGTDYCGGADHNFVIWLTNLGQTDKRWYSNVDLIWEEFGDGTAKLTGTVLDYTITNETYEVDVTYSGKTSTPPANSPKNHNCNDEDTSGWIYYPEMNGTITKTDGSEIINITKRGASFQVGNGANIFEKEEDKNGASGWLTVTEGYFAYGDININFGECVNEDAKGIKYLWSTGETTQSITVSPTEETTYTVTATNCVDCVGEDEVTVTVSTASANAGEDQTISAGDVAVLVATGGTTYEWSTGETTASIEVSPVETTTYSVIVSDNGCEDATDVTVVVEDCSVSANAGADQFICNNVDSFTKNAQADSVVLTASLGDSYFWSTGETTRAITVTPDNTITYTVTVIIGTCSDSDDVIVFVDENCDDEDTFAETLAVYPTLLKSTDQVKMEFHTNKDESVTISVHSLSGKSVGPITASYVLKGDATIAYDLNQIGGLSQGIYLIKIVAGNQTKTERVIIK